MKLECDVTHLLRQTVLAMCIVLAGCAVQPTLQQGDPYAPTLPVEPEPVQGVDGAIYAAGRDVRLFEDVRARRVGDILTIRLMERTDARKSSSTSTSKGTEFDLPNPTLAGRPVTSNGTPILEQSIENERSFAGEGDSSQSNSLSGSVTVTVARVLGNGNLEVRGEKWITINQGQEFVRFSGIVRPYDVQPDNSVGSDKVAHARIAYSGKGALADANQMGWLARFFNSPWMPF